MTMTKKQIIIVEALVIRHPQGTKKVSVTGAGCLLECKNTEFVICKGYGVQATMIEGQNAFAPQLFFV